MLGVTVLGLFLTPVFYVVIRKFGTRRSKASSKAKARLGAARSGLKPSTQSGAMHVLVVDDERNIRRTFSLVLESMSHQVFTASNGREALEELRRNHYDAVFLDLKLSQESGLDVLEEIVRLSPWTRGDRYRSRLGRDCCRGDEAARVRLFAETLHPDQVRHILNNISRTKNLERRVAELNRD